MNKKKYSLNAIGQIRSLIHSVQLIRFGKDGFRRLAMIADTYCRDVDSCGLSCSYTFMDDNGSMVRWDYCDLIPYTREDFLRDKRIVMEDLMRRIESLKERNRQSYSRRLAEIEFRKHELWLFPELRTEPAAM